MLKTWEGFLYLSLLGSSVGYSVGVYSFLCSAWFASLIRKRTLPGRLSLKDSESSCQILTLMLLVEWTRQMSEQRMPRGELQCLGGAQHWCWVCGSCRKDKLRLKEGEKHKPRRNGLRRLDDGVLLSCTVHREEILETSLKTQEGISWIGWGYTQWVKCFLCQVWRLELITSALI